MKIVRVGRVGEDASEALKKMRVEKGLLVIIKVAEHSFRAVSSVV